jgi:hypothetical protein
MLASCAAVSKTLTMNQVKRVDPAAAGLGVTVLGAHLVAAATAPLDESRYRPAGRDFDDRIAPSVIVISGSSPYASVPDDLGASPKQLQPTSCLWADKALFSVASWNRTGLVLSQSASASATRLLFGDDSPNSPDSFGELWVRIPVQDAVVGILFSESERATPLL